MEYIAIWTIEGLKDQDYSRISELVKRVLVNEMDFELLDHQNTTAVRGPDADISGAEHLLDMFWDEVEGGDEAALLAEDILVQGGQMKRRRALMITEARAKAIEGYRQQLYTVAQDHLNIDFITSKERYSYH